MILCSSCKHYVFEDQYINTEGYKIYLFPLNLPSSYIGEEQPLLDRGFVIEDNTTINEIIKAWKFPYSDNKEFPSYKLFFVNGNDIYYSFSINYRLDFLQTGHGNYEFKPDYLLKYKQHFNSLIGYELEFDNIDLAQKCKTIMINNDIFLPIPGVDSVFIWEKYRGEIEVTRSKFSIPIDASYDFDDVITNDLKPYLKNIEIFKIDSKKSKDSISIQAFCNVEIVELPKEYRVVRNLELFDSASFTVFGTDKESVLKICESNHIKPKEVHEKKY